MKEFKHIAVAFEKKTATIWLNRPDKHNALNAEMIAELNEAIRLLGENPDIRIVLLRGSGKSFCAGADLQYMKTIASAGEEGNYRDALQLALLFESVYTCPKPVLAIVHGAVYGGANGLSAACDMVLAHSDTVFAFSEVKLGITPATISPYVIKRCGEAAARELMLTGRRFDASDAYRFLLANKLYHNNDELETILSTYMADLLAAAPGAIHACKKLVSDVTASVKTTAEMMEDTARRIASQRASEEGQEGLAAFFEKRKPRWNNQ
jgi:methylglutaconyl-CoA hydratase